MAADKRVRNNRRFIPLEHTPEVDAMIMKARQKIADGITKERRAANPNAFPYPVEKIKKAEALRQALAEFVK